jgi:hypothetical protein
MRIDDAKAFLWNRLAAGPVATGVLIERAKIAGISEITLRRAAKSISIRAVRSGFGRNGRWVWQLPPRLITDNENSVSTLQAGPVFRPWKRRLRLLT